MSENPNLNIDSKNNILFGAGNSSIGGYNNILIGGNISQSSNKAELDSPFGDVVDRVPGNSSIILSNSNKGLLGRLPNKNFAAGTGTTVPNNCLVFGSAIPVNADLTFSRAIVDGSIVFDGFTDTVQEGNIAQNYTLTVWINGVSYKILLNGVVP